MSDTWDLPEGQTQFCQACEDEIEGLRATVEHQCGLGRESEAQEQEKLSHLIKELVAGKPLPKGNR